MSHGTRSALAECYGTFALVFAGTGAIVIDDVTAGGVSHVGIALTFGLVVMALIYAIGDLSGAHLNPAVTLGFTAARRMDPRRAGVYVFAQVAGACLASLALAALFPGHPNLGATIPAGSALQSLGLEVFLTAFLMFVILGVSTGAREKGIVAGIAVGGTVGLEALFAGPISGASMNPARSLGPALVSGELGALWVYLLAPPLGALLACAAWRSVESPEARGDVESSRMTGDVDSSATRGGAPTRAEATGDAPGPTTATAGAREPIVELATHAPRSSSRAGAPAETTDRKHSRR